MYTDGRWTPEEIEARIDGTVGQEKMPMLARLEEMAKAAASGDKPNVRDLASLRRGSQPAA